MKEEIWCHIHGIQDLGSDFLGQRLIDLVFDLEKNSDALIECKVNLTHDAHRLFNRQWVDQEKEIDTLPVSLSEVQASHEEALHRVEALLVCHRSLLSEGLVADIET